MGGPIGGNRINHMLYANDLCVVILSSAGLRQLLSICDQYCAMHSSMNKTCDITNVVLRGNTIDYMRKTKY